MHTKIYMETRREKMLGDPGVVHVDNTKINVKCDCE
jgi:hypothetical protein